MIDADELDRIKQEIRNLGGISDGPVSMPRYQRARKKIVWVLREPHESDPQKTWDLSDFLANPFVYPRWHCTYGLIAKVSYALLLDPPASELPVLTARNAVDSLKDVAVINVKKTGGMAQCNWKKLKAGASQFREILKRQIEALSPDIIITGGTAEFLTGVPVGSKTKTIPIYHPSQTRLEHASIYKRIYEAITA